MILMLHIAIAISSVIFALYTLASPSSQKMKASFALVGVTIATGTYMVWIEPAHMMQACVSGLTYITVVLVALAASQRKLLTITSSKK